MQSVQSYERIVLFRLGLLWASLGPGEFSSTKLSFILAKILIKSQLLAILIDDLCTFVLVISSSILMAPVGLMLWLGSLTVTCQTCNPEVTQRRRFNSAPGHCRVTTLGKFFTHMCLCHQAV